jgi:hypothetical protein
MVNKPQSGDILVELKIKMFLSPVGTTFSIMNNKNKLKKFRPYGTL